MIRLSRLEYWLRFLFGNMLLLGVFVFILILIGTRVSLDSSVILSIVFIGVYVAIFAIGFINYYWIFLRMVDVGFARKYILLTLIPIIGFLFTIVITILPSDYIVVGVDV